MLTAKIALILFALLYVLPLGISALIYRFEDSDTDWRVADRSSTGQLAAPSSTPQAVIRIFAAQTVRWRGIFATHTWIVLKPAGAGAYTRYDYTAWGDPVRVNGFEPDGRWFGRPAQLVFAADGDAAASLIPKMQAAIRDYAWRKQGDYRAWPGPNSNTFTAAVLDAVPELHVTLPSTAIGRDYPYDGRWLRWAHSGTGVTMTAGGYVGLTLAWVEGIEVNILGGVAGVDLRRPAIKLPGLGRFGLSGDTALPPALRPALG